MEHLSYETLARLVDERPSTDERAHLASCGACSAELDTMRAEISALEDLPRMLPPRGDWQAIEARLMSEGLIHARARTWFAPAAPAWTRIAAAVALFLGGTLTGAALPAASGTAGRDASAPERVAEARTAEEAAEVVRQVEQDYLTSLLQYRQLAARQGQSLESSDPVSRAAALDMLVAASQSALQAAPDDPFLNGFLVNALAERQVAARRLADASGTWY